ncbi:hypothetical protein RUND412_005976 [Rhizina undulata]
MSSYRSSIFAISCSTKDDDEHVRCPANSPAMTERTPLLATPINSYVLSISEAPDDQTTVRSDSEISTIIYEAGDLSPIISKVNSNATLEIEGDALSSHPGRDGDFRLPKDSNLHLNPDEAGAKEGNEFSFHGGITENQFWIIFAGILMANFVAAFDSTIMASTHTSITSAFNASNSASWLSTSFLLTSTAFQPLYGRLSDVLGRRVPFVGSCLIFSLATVWCAIAPNVKSFILARAICGIGAGGMLTMGAIVLSDLLPIEIRGTYQSINNLAYGVGSALGAALGGFLADALGWRWEFGIQVPFGLFSMAVCYFTIPENLGRKSEASFWKRFAEFDVAGSVYLTTSVAFLILGMSLGGNIYEWTNPIVLGSLALAVVLGTLLVRVEKKAVAPVMPLHLLVSHPRGNLIFNNFFGMMSIATIIFNLPLYFQTVLLESATVAGGRLLIPSVAGTIASVATGIIITRTGCLHHTIYVGCVFLVIGTITLCCMDRSFPNWAFLLFLIPSNLGLGFIFPSTLMSVLATSTQSEQAVATSTLTMWRCIGNVIGVASSSLIVQNGLLSFLEVNVVGPEKEEIIRRVRSSVTAIFDLPKGYQEQVIKSYISALRLCFGWAVVTAVASLILILGIRLPVIKTQNKKGAKKMEEGYQHIDCGAEF